MGSYFSFYISGNEKYPGTELSYCFNKLLNFNYRGLKIIFLPIKALVPQSEAEPGGRCGFVLYESNKETFRTDSTGVTSLKEKFTMKEKHNYKPPNGYVPDAETAVTIAVAIWIPIYGEDEIKKQKPYTAELNDTVWIVTGSLPEGSVGGVALAEISKESGQIIRVSHGK